MAISAGIQHKSPSTWSKLTSFLQHACENCMFFLQVSACAGILMPSSQKAQQTQRQTLSNEQHALGACTQVCKNDFASNVPKVEMELFAQCDVPRALTFFGDKDDSEEESNCFPLFRDEHTSGTPSPGVPRVIYRLHACDVFRAHTRTGKSHCFALHSLPDEM